MQPLLMSRKPRFTFCSSRLHNDAATTNEKGCSNFIKLMIGEYLIKSKLNTFTRFIPQPNTHTQMAIFTNHRLGQTQPQLAPLETFEDW